MIISVICSFITKPSGIYLGELWLKDQIHVQQSVPGYVKVKNNLLS